ncbi:unnamed protein product [Knipowitschia caucasica]
MLGDIG